MEEATQSGGEGNDGSALNNGCCQVTEAEMGRICGQKRRPVKPELSVTWDTRRAKTRWKAEERWRDALEEGLRELGLEEGWDSRRTGTK